MSRTTIAFGIAAALGFAVSLGAQTTTTADQRPATRSDKGREVTVTGCLARGSDGTYMLNNAKINENASSSRSGATTTTGSATTTGAPNPTTTTAGTTGATTTAGSPMSWKLEGGTDLERHVGHKIEVTGHTEWNEHSSMPSSSSPSTTTTTGTTGAASTMSSGPRLDVSSVKMISTGCQ